ncbi:MAG TPA: hypothetical protein VGI97_14860 [Gemmatimonadaceae bacterium]|jgi:hypothetical protein
MSLRSLESAIVSELRAETGDRTLRIIDMMEWATTPVKAQGDEVALFLPLNKVYVAYLPRPKTAKPSPGAPK